MAAIATDTRSITAMNGSVQGYEDTYRTLDAREASAMGARRVASFMAERPPFYMRETSVRTSQRNMARQMSEFDRLFAPAGGA